jgi:hypothetical protein
MNNYLIKRNPDFSKYGIIEKRKTINKVYSESIITSSIKSPLPGDLNVGDRIWVAESGWGIYANGLVKEIVKVEIFDGVDSLISFIDKDRLKDSAYWLDKVIRFKSRLEQDPSCVFKFQEYFIDQKLLNIAIPLVGNLERLGKPGLISSMIKLTENEIKFLEVPSFEKVKFKLNGNIPSALKLDIYSFFNTNLAIQHFIDIDHFVPKSIGGPGNIIENLIPIGLSLNRYKSNSIPKGFFLEASKYPELKLLFSKDYFIEKTEFISGKDAIDDALKINSKIWKWDDLDKIRIFYKSVMNYHFPQYIKVIEKYREIKGY